ncbi:CtrA inhibitor SciP [Pseudogemmobacter sp. W21_MBD1_M6]|uniref:CtrA inhibitor SciP n=1 Tax=Pseudogemmobacter sp. W21_MBD1_M6 TaxID=3240271 RepID=UPI003F943244
MFLKKVDGPRAVTLPGGRVLTRADLPPDDTLRWVASRKAVVVMAVATGLILRSEAMATYGLSDEEYDGWESAIKRHGIKALKVTSVQKYRQL